MRTKETWVGHRKHLPSGKERLVPNSLDELIFVMYLEQCMVYKCSECGRLYFPYTDREIFWSHMLFKNLAIPY